ncbi:MAG: T9SS type A sorting domain-containing protein [Sporocytophaga sp.]|nr:T9SS type A sorting domain-containing protein [Sporocytophaga sp.]
MKKLLLSGLLVAGLFSAKAQNCANVGLSSSALYENFSSAEDWSSTDGTKGIYPFGDPDGGEGDENPNFYATVTRNPVTGTLDVTQSQAAGEFVPFGLALGEDVVIDLSQNSTFSITATNPGDLDIKIRIAIQDINGNLVNSYADASEPDCYLSQIEKVIPAGATETLEGNFAGGFNATYPGGEDENGDPIGCVLVQNLDYTKVNTILITVVNNAQGGAPDWLQEALPDYSFSIDEVRVGDCATITGMKSAAALVSSSKLYPNPTSESASLELSLKEASDVKVTLSDLMGREVAVIANERGLDVNKSFSTANLAKGMYTVNYFINGAPAKAELLMVK